MKLLYVLINNNNEILMQKNLPYYTIPSASEEVDLSYGFDTVENDNLWFHINCGMQVYRKYVFFYHQYCVAVFELHKIINLVDNYLWIKLDSINEYVENHDELEIISNAIKNYDYSKNVPWAGSGFQPYLSWVNSVAEQQKFSIIGQAKQIKNAYVSSLFIIPTNIGDLYLKIPSTTYLNDVVNIEYFLTRVISGLPDFIAISPDKRAYLTKDMKGYDLPPQIHVEALKNIVKHWAVVQQKYTSSNKLFADKLSTFHDYTSKEILSRLETFPSEISFLFDYMDRPLNEETILKLKNKLCTIKELFIRLEECKIPNTLCHGDLRPGNIRLVSGSFIFYDWGMSIYSHPFYDICHFLHVIRRQLSETDKKRIVCTYLNQWECFESSENLIKAFNLIEKLKDFFMTYQDHQWLLEILKASGYKIEKYSIDDWLFSRRSYYFLRVFDRFING